VAIVHGFSRQIVAHYTRVTDDIKRKNYSQAIGWLRASSQVKTVNWIKWRTAAVLYHETTLKHHFTFNLTKGNS
jgi:hypothetical protein